MTTQEMLDDRYGRTHAARGRVWMWIGVGVAGIAAVAFLAWSAFATSGNVDAVGTGYKVIDHRSVQVQFQLTAPVGSEVVCILEADDPEHGIVGWKVVKLAPSTDHMQAYSETIPTVAEATNGLVNTCWVA
jgi:hypothetical protein